MSSSAVELAMRWHRCDPKPDRCAACFRGADAGVEFFTPDAAVDRGTIIDPVTGAPIVSLDDLEVCAVFDDGGRLVGGCAHELLTLCGFKPELHQRQLREIRRLELTVEHWRDYAQRIEAALSTRPDTNGKAA